MEYRIEVYDTWGRRIAAYDEVPLLDLVRSGPDQADAIRGLLPAAILDLGHAYRVRAFVDGTLFCEALVEETAPQWSDTQKLILDKYVSFQMVAAFEARGPRRNGNTWVSRAYVNREVSAIVKDVINSAPGALHYTVDHDAYPDGAAREYAKFLARKTAENELEVGGIASGQWVDGSRMDLTGAYAKDGDTIAGIVVDGASWPDLRLMLIDAEETSLNSHAVKRHPEVGTWTSAQYDASGYKLKGDAAKAALQDLIDTKGIDYIELNPHKNSEGAFDDRVDAYGRYLGLVFGGGECFNAAVVEQGLADVYLYNDGQYLVPEMALKDFFSYDGAHADSVAATGVALAELDIRGGALEVLAALCYAANGFVFSVDAEQGVRFHKADVVDEVLFHDPVVMGVQLGSDSDGLGNQVYFKGSPFSGTVNQTYSRDDSRDEYGDHGRTFEYFSISRKEDADKLAGGLLDDVAYPAPSGAVTFYNGNSAVKVGDILELRDGPLRRLERELAGEWGGRFTGRLVGRVREVRHRISGRHVMTTAYLTSPLRSVESPLSFIVRSQGNASSLFEFRLDDSTVGLDMGFHLD